MIFVLAAFVGFEVISKVPSILHTPLMSGSNAIHGVILVGAMIVANEAHGALQIILALAAIILATVNIVGGVVVTDRMLEMFKGREPGQPPAASARRERLRRQGRRRIDRHDRPQQRPGRRLPGRRRCASSSPSRPSAPRGGPGWGNLIGVGGHGRWRCG